MPSVTNSATAKSTGSVASLTYSHVSDGNPLYVHVALWNNLSGEPRRSGVTFNGVALDCAAVSAGGSQWTHEVWYLASPATTTANVVITPIGSNTWISAASYNVSGGHRPNHFIFETGTGTAPTATIASTSGDLVLDLVSSDATSQTWTVGAGQTLIGSNTSANSDAKCAASYEAGAASVTMSWTLGVSDEWGVSAFNVPASAMTTEVVQAIHDPAYAAVSGSSKTLTFNRNTVAGHDIVVGLYYPVGTGVATLTSVTDSQGSTYALAGTFTASSSRVDQWVAHNIVGGACTVTVTFTAAISTYQSAIELLNAGQTGSAASAQAIGTAHAAGSVTTTGAAVFIETSAVSTGLGHNEATDDFLPIRTQGRLIINVRQVNASATSTGPYTSTVSLTSENLLVAYAPSVTAAIQGSLVAGVKTTVAATRAIAFGLDDAVNVLSEAGKFKVFGTGEYTDQLTVIDPVDPQDAVPKHYCDGNGANASKRSRVRAATTANITISTALNNGDSLDGVSLATDDLVLVKNQAAPEQNGVYVVGVSPARFSEYDTYNEHPGSLIAVQEGSTNADTLWLCTSNVGGTLNTTAINFTAFTASGAPVGASYVTLATDATLTSERVLTAGTGISLTDAGAGSTITIATVGGSGGSGNITETGAAGSEPGSPDTGDLYLPNNGMYVERYSGSVWAQWGPIFPMTPFVDSGFSWVNQGSATLDLTYGNAFFRTPAASGNNVRAYVKTAPSTPYTITIAFTPMLSNSGTNFATGMCFRESGSGKIIIFYFNNTEAFAVAKWTNATTFSASYTDLGLHTAKRSGGLAFLRIADNGTDRICSVSIDGQHWETVHTVGRTDFLTADQVGVFVYADSATTTLVTAMSLLSWKAA